MPETIEGGAYQIGERWVDANGQPLKKAQVAEAERLHAERAETLAAQAEETNARALANSPEARAIVQALREGTIAPAAAAAKPAPRRAAPKPADDGDDGDAGGNAGAGDTTPAGTGA
jgi:hypothetical protein